MNTLGKWVGLALTVFQFGASIGGRSLADDVKPTTRVKAIIPFTQGPGGEIYVRATLNGKATATFLVDTGVDSDYLSDTVAGELGLPTIQATHGGKPLSLNGKALRGMIVPNVVTGQVRYPAIAFGLLSAGQLPETPDHQGRIDGILGAPVLMSFAVLLDYAHNQMTVWSPADLSVAEMNREGFQPLGTIPIIPSPTDENQWTAHVKFTEGTDTSEQDLTVDTGANRTTVSSTVARGLKLKKDGDGQASLFLNKPITMDFGHVTEIQIGDITLRNQTVYYAEQDLLEYPISLSMNLFRGYAILLDFGRKKMYVGTLKASPK